jgi:hypothetical protein
MSVPVPPQHRTSTYLIRHGRITRTERLLPSLRHAAKNSNHPVIVLLEPLRVGLWRASYSSDGSIGSRGELLSAEEFGAVKHGKGLERLAV